MLTLLALALVVAAPQLPAGGGAAPGGAPGVAAPDSSAARPRSADGRLTITAVVAAAPIILDGVLDEASWRAARPATGFVQAEPHEGDPATERTDVRVVFDGATLYIGATLRDRDAGRLIVNDIRKDFDEENQDDFEVILDTFGDRRNGYVFTTNPAGARADRQVSNEGREVNASWDAAWSVATRRTADGWVAEMAIPLRALRFDAAANPVWGINFSRRIRRRNEIDFWSPVPRAYTIDRLSLAGNLLGLQLAGAGRDLRIKPYVLGKTVRETGGTRFADRGDLGADVKWGVARGLTLDLTANPDFAQVEADEQQVNLTQFDQFFPEKREFFLENSGIFYVGDQARNSRVGGLAPTPDEDLLLFFSRRIGLTADGLPIPIDGGARLTGTTGRWAVGALSMLTRADAGQPENLYAVLRVRRNLAVGSDVGAVYMERRALSSTDSLPRADDRNQVFGADANIRFFGRLDWNSYVIGTRTPGATGGQYAWRTTVNREGNSTHLKLGIMSVGDGFQDDLGYYRRTDVRKWLMDVGLRPRFAWLQGHGVREMHPHLVWNYYEDQRGKMIGKDLHSGYTFFTNDGGYVELSVNAEYEFLTDSFAIDPHTSAIPAGGYWWTEYALKGETDPSRLLSVDWALIGGGLWSGHQRTADIGLTARPGYRLQLSLGLERTAATLDVPRDARFVATLWTTRIAYAFSTRMFLDALSQYDPGQHLLNANVRFNFIHHPLSDLYLVYDEQRFTTRAGGNAGRAVIVKFTQMLAL